MSKVVKAVKNVVGAFTGRNERKAREAQKKAERQAAAQVAREKEQARLKAIEDNKRLVEQRAAEADVATQEKKKLAALSSVGVEETEGLLKKKRKLLGE